MKTKEISVYNEVEMRPKDIIVTQEHGEYNIYLVSSVFVARYNGLTIREPLFMVAYWPVRVVINGDNLIYVNELYLRTL